MSRKEVLAVIRGGYRTYLLSSGFEKPVIEEDIIFRHTRFPNRELRIFTAPMLRGQLNYQLHLPGLDDYQSIFRFQPNPDFYLWPGVGWFEYRDETDLVHGFDYAKQVHDEWLNDLLNKTDISLFTERLNEIRRRGVERYAKSSAEEKTVNSEQSKREQESQSQFIRDFPPTGWSSELIERLSLEGKLKKRESQYWIDGNVIRGPKYDSQFSIQETRILFDGQPTHYGYYGGQFFDDRQRTVRYFEQNGRIWGPPGDPPWILECEAASIK